MHVPLMHAVNNLCFLAFTEEIPSFTFTLDTLKMPFKKFSLATARKENIALKPMAGRPIFTKEVRSIDLRWFRKDMKMIARSKLIKINNKSA